MEQNFILRFTDIQAGEDRTISGTAIIFDVESQPLYDIEGIVYTEIIRKGAITQELINSSDILLTYNHEEHQAVPLARSNKGKGSLKITLTDNTVDFSFKPKATNSGNEIYEAVRQGDLSGCSFKFYLKNNPSDHKFIRKADGTYLHEVFNIAGIRDLSIVTVPAYAETSVYARQLSEQLKADEAKLAEQARLEAEKQAQELALQRQKELEYQDYLTRLKKTYL